MVEDVLVPHSYGLRAQKYVMGGICDKKNNNAGTLLLATMTTCWATNVYSALLILRSLVLSHSLLVMLGQPFKQDFGAYNNGHGVTDHGHGHGVTAERLDEAGYN